MSAEGSPDGPTIPGVTSAAAAAWPALPLVAWQDTRDTVHMWTQIVGKIRLSLMPMINHWWQVPLYVSSRGLTTSVMPYGDRGVEMEFDFQRHVLEISTTDGRAREIRLEPRSVADFYAETVSRLAELDAAVRIVARPTEVELAIPFADDQEHASYDAAYARLFWQSLVQADRIFTNFRSGFAGKASRVNFWWGAFDLASARFSGRTAPPHPGGVPHCPDWVMREAYSHEVSSHGYWPGGADEGAFYAYAYPPPPGYSDWPVEPEAAYYDPGFREFILPYQAVRTANDPEAMLKGFLKSTYEAAAQLGGWDRRALER
jgi:hypothetical protein